MPHSLPLPAFWSNQGWKVKLRDRERVEPPHVTIICRRRSWRLALRNGDFLDEEPDPAEVPWELVSLVREQFETLRVEWNRMYPENPVASENDS